MKRQLAEADILPFADYERVRREKRGAIMALKKKRRVAVGPYATFYFENYDTMWLQVQEMLRVEKGGAEQMEDELRAYNPLIPNGRELVATVMFEIEDPGAARAKVLGAIGGVEKTMFLKIKRARSLPESRKRISITRRTKARPHRFSSYISLSRPRKSPTSARRIPK